VRGIQNQHWIQLGLRAFYVFLNQKENSPTLVQKGYNDIASFYDTYWTQYMAAISEDMLKRLAPHPYGKCLDLTCGTGFLTIKLHEITSGEVTGVDASEHMIAIARKKYGASCRFLTSDAYQFLTTQPSNCYDCITCAWGFGYLPPQILQEISRTLRYHGKLGILDNSVLSNWEFIASFLVAVSEEPSALVSYIKPHFSLTAGTLTQRMRRHGFHIVDAWNGKKVFSFRKETMAMEQLTRSGVAAGIIQMIEQSKREKIIRRTGELLQKHHTSTGNIPITHRYLGAIGEKKK
jgi:ubiquinone/menaquinone biosynthesis C-methylase UbiE